jgi:hypothetical protein
MTSRTKKIVLISAVIVSAIAIASFVIVRRRKRGGKRRSSEVNENENYVIGDSQTPFIDKNSTLVSRIGENGNESNLWKGGKGLSWLKDSVVAYPVSPSVNSIVINIGTNGGFNANEDVKGLVDAIKSKFPNARLFAVQGSWGWGGNKNVTQDKVKKYYDKFKQEGVEIIEPAIGSVSDPHGNLPIYAEIGAELDKRING